MIDYTKVHKSIKDDWICHKEEIILIEKDWFIAMCDKSGVKRYEIWHICSPSKMNHDCIMECLSYLGSSDKCHRCNVKPYGKILSMYRLLTIGIQ